MRIAIDLTSLLPEPTGCDTYMKQLVRHLGKVDLENLYDIYVNYEDRRLFNGDLPDNFAVTPLSLRPRACRLAFQQALLPFAALFGRASVVHSPSFISPILQFGRRHVLTVHDMTFFSLPGFHIPLRRSPAFKSLVLRSIRNSHAILVPSVATKKHIAEFAPDAPPDRTHIVPYGIGPEFFVRGVDETERERLRLGLPPSYILAVGTIEPRKNLGRLIDAYSRLVTEHGIREHLVLAGRLGWSYEEILAKLDAPALRGRVHRPGFVAASELPWYYAGARLCAYPSIQEGFGFPPLEAMACGVPVISSSTSSLMENLQGAAELVPPQDPDALAEAMRRLLTDSSHYARLRQAGLARAAQFSWNRTAANTVEVYRLVA